MYVGVGSEVGVHAWRGGGSEGELKWSKGRGKRGGRGREGESEGEGRGGGEGGEGGERYSGGIATT